MEMGLAGRPLPPVSMPYALPADALLGAMISGPPRYIVRLRRIEDGIQRLLGELEGAWRDLAARRARDPARFAREWTARVEQRDTAPLNRLIAAHNAWYPAEAGLPMSGRTGDFIPRAGQAVRLEPVTSAWLLARFPADLARALAATSARPERQAR